MLAVSGVEPSLEERVRRFDEVARLVLGAARSRPLLVVLDDMDGADEPSQLLVQYLARTARDDRLLVVVCCRDTAGPLAALAQEPNATQVELRGLERAAVGEQVSGDRRAGGQRRRAGCGVRRHGGQPVLRLRACPSAGRRARAPGCRTPVCARRDRPAPRAALRRTARRRCVRRRCSGPGSRSRSSRR